MNPVLTADPLAEPTPEEIARIRAELQEMYAEAERSFARMDANRVEIDQLRAETQVMLDSIKEAMRH